MDDLPLQTLSQRMENSFFVHQNKGCFGNFFVVRDDPINGVVHFVFNCTEKFPIVSRFKKVIRKEKTYLNFQIGAEDKITDCYIYFPELDEVFGPSGRWKTTFDLEKEQIYISSVRLPR